MQDFMWKFKNKGVAWKMLLPVEEGGLGLKDPETVFEESLIRIIRLTRTKAAQPWVKWLKHKEAKLKDQWKIAGSVFGHKPTKEQQSKLISGDLLHEMVKAWHKAEGTTLIREQIKTLNAASWIASAFTEE